MAYCDLEFYKDSYSGTVVPDLDFKKFADRASDFLDVITFDRLVMGLPEGERIQSRIKKAVCAVAEKMYQLDLAERQAINSASAESSSQGGTSTGVVTSVSAGSESISYAAPSQIAAGAKEWSAVYVASGDQKMTNMILYAAAALYLTGIRDDKGVPLLYAGF